MNLKKNDNTLPDIVSCKQPPQYRGRLDKVGMGDIQVPINIERKDLGRFFSVANANAYVSLDNQDSRGIHMSRLYLILQKYLANEILSFNCIKQILLSFLESHKNLSKNAHLELSYKHPITKSSLVSKNNSWYFYDVTYDSSLMEDKFTNKLHFKIVYSSTCPCSATLARQKVQEHFKACFAPLDPNAKIPAKDIYAWLEKEENTTATPHSQRSVASISLDIKDTDNFCIDTMILSIEEALQTPVQGAVKRSDEQMFAERNAKNLMFAEDAARRIKNCLIKVEPLHGFTVKVSHQESLHPHNAEAYVSFP
jgi:GTP cyclohydrolase IB